jgi:4-hydroxy-tetrahydrodipicolinate synthase
LLRRYPGTIAGIKDSSGDWNNTRAMLEQVQPRGFDVFAGSETFLLATLRGGWCGVHQRDRQRESRGDCEAGPRVAETGRRTAAVCTRWGASCIPEVPDDTRAQGLHCAFLGDDSWTSVRPPLVALSDELQRQLLESLNRLGFAMPGLAREKADPLAQAPA